MAPPKYRGRLLPRNDWEGDDFAPYRVVPYVTCCDTACGRAVSWATNGRIDQDGKVYRRAVNPPDPNGITLDQAAQAVASVAHLPLLRPIDWGEREVKFWLRTKAAGLVIQGIYAEIPRQYRFQAGGDFGHSMFVSHLSWDGKSMRLYDPLNPATHEYGKHVPSEILWPFLKSLAYRDGAYRVAYVPLQPL